MNENEEDLGIIVAWFLVGLVISVIISFFIKRAAKKRVGFNMDSVIVMLCIFGLTLILTEIFYWLGIISYLMQFFAILIALFNLQISAIKRPFSYIRETSEATQAKEAARKAAANGNSEQVSEESSELSFGEKKE